MPADDRLRGLFDRLGAPPDPTAEQRDTARRHLYAAIAAAHPAPPWWRRAAVRRSAAAVVAAAVVALVLVVPASTPAVDANLAEIAAAARNVDEMSLPEGSYVYFRVESTTFDRAQSRAGQTIPYRLPTTEHLWVSGANELRQKTAGAPTFFTAADEEAFYASELPEAEGVGQTQTQSLKAIPNEEKLATTPTDPDELWDRIVEELSIDPEFSLANEAALLQHVAQLLGPRLNAPPELRGALLEILGRFDVTTSRTVTGGVMVLQLYEDDFGAYEQTLEFDTAGYLIREVLILIKAFKEPEFPTGVLEDIRYSRPVVVAAPGEFPAP